MKGVENISWPKYLVFFLIAFFLIFVLVDTFLLNKVHEEAATAQLGASSTKSDNMSDAEKIKQLQLLSQQPVSSGALNSGDKLILIKSLSKSGVLVAGKENKQTASSSLTNQEKFNLLQTLSH